MTTPSVELSRSGGVPDLGGTLLASLRRACRDAGTPAELLVAYSGGLDSACLLACAAETREVHGLPVRALHVDHGWSPDSQRWAEFCVDAAQQLGIACEVHRLATRPPAGASGEAWARDQRHLILQTAMTAGSVALTAHHRDDQAETFLLMALRGSGPRGLAGVAPVRPFGPGLLLRPFIDTPKADLQAFAAARALRWLDDPSNANEVFDRNFLRSQVLPLLKERWPAASATLARCAQWQQALLQLDVDGEAVLLQAAGGADVLPLQTLAEQPQSDGLRLLRAWIRAKGVPIPSAAHLERVLREMVPARGDRQPMIRWGQWALRRYQGALHLTAASLPLLREAHVWHWNDQLELPAGRLRAVSVVGQGIAQRLIEGRTLKVRARRGGECFRRAGDPHHRSLKHLWQSAGVPPWQRGAIPLVYLDERLLAVPGLGYAAEVAPEANEPAVTLRWEPTVQLS